MATVSTFNIALVASTGRFVSSIARAERQWNSFARSVQRQAKVLPKAIQEAVPASLALGRNVSKWAAVTTAALSALSGAGIKLAADFEQAQIAFETMLGSAERAERFLRELEVYARKTPFGFVGLQQAARQLLAYGFTADRVLTMIEPIGDAVAAMGGSSVMFESIIRALGQIQAKGKLAAQEFLQLSEQGIPAWQFLADMLGVTIPEAMDMASRGMVSSAVAIEAVLTGMTRRFGGAMFRQAETTRGMWERTTDSIVTIIRGWGQDVMRITGLAAAFATLAEAVERFADAVSLHGFIGALREAVPPWLQPVIVAIAGAIVGGLVPAIVAWLIPALKKLGVSLWTTIRPLQAWMIVGAAVAVMVYTLAKWWGNLGELGQRIWTGLGAVAMMGAAMFTRGVALIYQSLAWLIPGMQGAAQQVMALADQLRNAAIQAWQSATSTAQVAQSAHETAAAAEEAAWGQERLAEGLELAQKAASAGVQSFDEVHQAQEAMSSGLVLPDFVLPDFVLPDVSATSALAEGLQAVDNAINGIAESAAGAWQRLTQAMEPVRDMVERLRAEWPELGRILEDIASVIMAVLVPALVVLVARSVWAATQTALAWLTMKAEAGASAAAQVGQMALVAARWVWLGAVAMAQGARVAAGWVIAMGPIGWAIAAVASLAAAVWYYWDDIVAAAHSASEWAKANILPIWDNIVSALTTAWSTLRDAAVDVWGAILLAVYTVADWATNTVPQVWHQMVAAVSEAWQALLGVADDVWSAIAAAVRTVINWVRADVPVVWREVATAVGEVWTALADLAAPAWGSIRSSVQSVLDWAEATVGAVWQGVAGVVVGVWDGLATAAEVSWTAIRDVIASVWSWVQEQAQAVWAAASSVIEAVWSGLVQMATTTWQAVRSAIESVWAWAGQTAAAAWEPVRDVIIGVWDGLLTAAQTIWSGIRAAIEAVWSWVAETASAVWDGVRATIETTWTALETVAVASWGGIRGVIEAVWSWAVDTAEAVWAAVASAIASSWDAIAGAAVVAWSAVRDTIAAVWTWASETVQLVWAGVATVVAMTWDTIAQAAVTSWSAVRSAIEAVWTWAVDAAGVVWGAVADVTIAAWDGLVTVASSTWAAIRAAIAAAWDGLESWATAVWDGVASVTSAAWAALRAAAELQWSIIRGIITGDWEAVVEGVRTAVDAIKAAVESMVNRVRQLVQALRDSVLGWWDELTSGLIDGARNIAEKVGGWFYRLYDAVVGHSYVPDMVEDVLMWFGTMESGTTSVTASMMQQLQRQMAAGYGNMTQQSQQFGAHMMSWVGSVGKTLQTAFSQAFTGILNGTMSFADGMRSIFGSLGNSLQQLLVSRLAQSASQSLSTIGQWAAGVVTAVGRTIVAVLQQAYATLVAFFAWSGPAAPALAAGVIAAATVGIASVAKQALGSIPGLATGGIVTGPTLAMVGEGYRREAVIPLERDNVISESVGAAVFDAMMTASRLQAASGSGQAGASQEIVLRIDGATFARLLLPHLQREGQRQGFDVVVRPANGVV